MPESIIDGNTAQFVRREAAASGAVSPGHLVELDGNGDVQAHSTDAGAAVTLFATAAVDVGQSADDDYSDGDNVRYVEALGGGFNVMVAGGESVSPGDALVSNGDGTLRAAAGDGTEVDAHVAIARESFSDTEAGLVAVMPA